MTFEKKCLFEPSDVVAVHFECDHCHAAIVVPIVGGGIGNFASDSAAKSCQFCHTPWEISPNSEEHKVLVKFATSLESLSTTLKGRHLKLKLEVRCPDDQKA